jgi:hypothetical protein
MWSLSSTDTTGARETSHGHPEMEVDTDLFELNSELGNRSIPSVFIHYSVVASPNIVRSTKL